MIRFVVCDPNGNILRIGFCNDEIFNKQSVAVGEIVVEITAADWPVNDETQMIDLTGEEPVVVQKIT